MKEEQLVIKSINEFERTFFPNHWKKKQEAKLRCKTCGRLKTLCSGHLRWIGN